MSTSNLYLVYKTKVREVAEFRNGHGSAPPLWGWLGMNFLGWERNSDWLFSKDMRPLWNLAKDDRVPEWARICLAMTLDRAIITVEHQQVAANACLKCHEVIDAWPEWANCVNHWKAIGEAIATVKIPKRSAGLGLSCTSVSDVWLDRAKGRIGFDCVGYVRS